ncbi:MAG: glycoside hydrolase family 3 N-terminal domain-containing protein, partial [Thermoanaerobaculia bacterium]
MNSSVFFLIGVESTELTERERALFAKFPPGGVILFARNMADPDQLHSLVAEIRERAPGVLLFVDQEGGPVDRFRAIAGSSVSAARAARIGASRAAGEIAGALCSLFGIDVDLAPVVDRAVPAAGGVVLTERVVAENPDDVAKAGRQFLDGLALYGVAGCLKHFPGLGRGAVDSHVLLPVIDDDPRQLELDLLPFRKLRDAPAVMVSHAAFGRGALPSSLSRAVAHDLLREEAGFPGAAISDDLEMGALSAFGSLADRSAAALAAGCDLLCIGKQNEALPDAVEAVERMVPARRTLEALER